MLEGQSLIIVKEQCTHTHTACGVISYSIVECRDFLKKKIQDKKEKLM